MKSNPVASRLTRITFQLLSDKEVSAIMRVGTTTLRYWRARGLGPPFVRINKLIRYREDKLREWIEERAQKVG